jgi:hypothetical protein
MACCVCLPLLTSEWEIVSWSQSASITKESKCRPSILPAAKCYGQVRGSRRFFLMTCEQNLWTKHTHTHTHTQTQTRTRVVLVLPSRVKILTFISSNLLQLFRSREEPQNAKKHKSKTCSSRLNVNNIGNLDTAQLLLLDFRFVNANFRCRLINSVKSTIWSQNTWLFTVVMAPGSRSTRLYFSRRGTYRPWGRTQRSTLT